jgi:tetratricopeptide (TPR) repeat protein
MLDAEEYFHLALHATSVTDRHACLTYLQEVLRQQPMHARAMSLLAAVHAELGLIERAIGGMEAALDLDEDLDPARFQLALLLLFETDRRTEARMHLIRLADGRNGTLRPYAEALIAVADDDTVLAVQRLESAIAHTPGNADFTALMRCLADGLKNQEGTTSAT